MQALSPYLYLIASACFILSLRGLVSPKTSNRGNIIGMVGMALVIITTLSLPQVHNLPLILLAMLLGGSVGITISYKIKMTALPQLVALFHSLVGLAAVFIAMAAFLSPKQYGVDLAVIGTRVELGLGLVIGAITFTGSVVAFAKLQGLMRNNWPVFKGRIAFTLAFIIVMVVVLVLFSAQSLALSNGSFWLLLLLGLSFGVLAVGPIGGADMPVVVSVLNSYSGWAACGIGFTLSNPVLIVTGSLVGASGAILSYIMAKNMNRSILNVLMGGFGGDTSGTNTSSQSTDDMPIKQASSEDVAFFMQQSQSVIIVPGYGLAVAQAQHVVKEIYQKLKDQGIKVRFAIHPVAGRMPGHMNVLLAEANIDYEDVLELEEINRDFATCDVALVMGANDVTNPSAKTDPQSPIYGMPVLDVYLAKQVFFVKRSMAAGYAGVQNELFFKDNTFMVFGDAKHVSETIVQNL